MAWPGNHQDSSDPTRRTGGGTRQSLLLALILILLCLAAYYPVYRYGFIDLDDAAYVYANPHVLAPLGPSTIIWGLTHPFGYNYDPLTFFSHSLDVRLFQLNAGGHHLDNLFLHMLSAVLLFFVLRRATGFTGRSFMVAALFAVHPMNVENVAWIAERKTLLSTVFFFLALDAYRWYACDPKRKRMAVVAGIYILGLLSKPQIITLPCLFLLWDYWPLRRTPGGDELAPQPRDPLPTRSYAALIKEKIPLFVIAGFDAVLTMIAQHQVNVQNWPYSLGIRVENALVAYAEYVVKAFYPANLALEYNYPGNSLSAWQISGATLLLIAITALVIAGWRHRYLIVGWLWFLGFLVPTIGVIVQPDLQPVADRYAYISYVGLFLMVCWGFAEWAEHRHLPKLVLPIASCLVLVALTAVTHRQVGYWRDRETLWTHTLAVTHHNWVANMSLGQLAQERGNPQDALLHYYRALQDSPRDYSLNLTIALIEHQQRNLKQAIQHYQDALDAGPNDTRNAQIYANMGHAYSDLGDSDHARMCYLAAQRPPPPPPPAPEINWHGAWWRDLARVMRERYHEWRTNSSGAR